MSAYEKALTEGQRIDGLISAFESQITTRDRDKTGLTWRKSEASSETYLRVETEMYVGHYGSSSVYGRGSREAANELAKTLTALKPHIIEATVTRLRAEKTALLHLAVDEARAVLAQVEEAGHAE